jgi:hypothetical protein
VSDGVIFAANIRSFDRNCRKPWFRVVLLFAVWLTSCNNTCFTFISNPPTGTIGIKVSDPKATCGLTSINGAIRVHIDTEPASTSCTEPCQVQHMFVSIRGIELHPSTNPDNDPAEWQELAPHLAKQPLQVDLVRGMVDRSARELLGETVPIPAGVYRRVRLRFVPNHLVSEDQPPEKNACGSTGFNCVVLADGRTQPLLLDDRSPDLLMTLDRDEGVSFFVPPETDTDLAIELKLAWVWFSSADKGMRVLPALTGSAKIVRVEFDDLGTPEDGVVHDSLTR